MSKLYKRGKVWWAWHQGQRRSTRCTDKRAAELTVAEWQREAASPAYAAARSVSLSDGAEHMIDNAKTAGRSERTIAYYEGKIGHLLRVIGDEAPLSAIDAKAVDGYMKKRREEGATHATLAKEIGALRRILRVAKRRGEYPHDIAAVLPEGFGTGYEPRRAFLSEKDAARLLATLSPKRAAWVAFAIGTGARLGEINRARREDIDLKAGIVHLRGTKTKKARRVVPITTLSRPLVKLARRDGDGEGGLLFSAWDNVQRDLALACEKVGIGPLTPNDLRRTHATWLRARGVDAATIAELLGHVDSRMVERVYGRLTTDMLAASLERHIDKAAVSILYGTGSDSEDTEDTEDAESSAILRARHDSNVRPADSKSDRKSDDGTEKQGESAAGSGASVSDLYGEDGEPPRRAGHLTDSELLREVRAKLRPLAKIAAAFKTPMRVGGAR